MLPALIPVALSLAPYLTRLLAGDRAGDTAAAVAGAVQSVTGTTDPAQAAAALEADPGLRADLSSRLAEMAIEAERIAAADRADARAMARAGGPLMWGAFGVTAMVLALFAFSVVGSAFGLTVNDPLAKLLEYGLVAILGFWLGSSAGSAAKSGLLGPFGGRG